MQNMILKYSAKPFSIAAKSFNKTNSINSTLA